MDPLTFDGKYTPSIETIFQTAGPNIKEEFERIFTFDGIKQEAVEVEESSSSSCSLVFGNSTEIDIKEELQSSDLLVQNVANNCSLLNEKNEKLDTSTYTIKEPQSESQYLDKIPLYMNIYEQSLSKSGGKLKKMTQREKHKEKCFKCTYCDHMANSQKLIREHVYHKHLNVVMYCPHCDFKSSKSITLKQHIKNIHSDLSVEQKNSIIIPSSIENKTI